MQADATGATAADLLSRLATIRAVAWRWEDSEAVRARGLTPGARASGVLAQDVEAVFPDLVFKDEEGVRRVDYNGLIALALEAITVLDARVRALEEAQDAAHGD